MKCNSEKAIAELPNLVKALKGLVDNACAGCFFRYTPATHKKLDAIAKQIAYNIRQKRISAGIPINDAGYSGRQTNKRRRR